jgi:hypothetical protein
MGIGFCRSATFSRCARTTASIGAAYREPRQAPSSWAEWFDRNGNILSNVGDPGTYTALALSPDETRVAAAQSYPGSEIWTSRRIVDYDFADVKSTGADFRNIRQHCLYS